MIIHTTNISINIIHFFMILNIFSNISLYISLLTFLTGYRNNIKGQHLLPIDETQTVFKKTSPELPNASTLNETGSSNRISLVRLCIVKALDFPRSLSIASQTPDDQYTTPRMSYVSYIVYSWTRTTQAQYCAANEGAKFASKYPFSPQRIYPHATITHTPIAG